MVAIGESRRLVFARLEETYVIAKPNDGLALVWTKPVAESTGVKHSAMLGTVEFSGDKVSKVSGETVRDHRW